MLNTVYLKLSALQWREAFERFCLMWFWRCFFIAFGCKASLGMRFHSFSVKLSRKWKSTLKYLYTIDRWYLTIISSFCILVHKPLQLDLAQCGSFSLVLIYSVRSYTSMFPLKLNLIAYVTTSCLVIHKVLSKQAGLSGTELVKCEEAKVLVFLGKELVISDIYIQTDSCT